MEKYFPFFLISAVKMPWLPKLDFFSYRKQTPFFGSTISESFGLLFGGQPLDITEDWDPSTV